MCMCAGMMPVCVGGCVYTCAVMPMETRVHAPVHMVCLYGCVCVGGVHCTCAGVYMHACGDLRWALGIFYHSTLHSLAKGLVSLN